MYIYIFRYTHTYMYAYEPPEEEAVITNLYIYYITDLT